MQRKRANKKLCRSHKLQDLQNSNIQNVHNYSASSDTPQTKSTTRTNELEVSKESANNINKQLVHSRMIVTCRGVSSIFKDCYSQGLDTATNNSPISVQPVDFFTSVARDKSISHAPRLNDNNNNEDPAQHERHEEHEDQFSEHEAVPYTIHDDIIRQIAQNLLGDNLAIFEQLDWADLPCMCASKVIKARI